MLRDSQQIIDIYKRNLEIISDLTEILERHYDKLDDDTPEVKRKRIEFANKAKAVIEKFDEDIHDLFKLSREVLELERNKNDNSS